MERMVPEWLREYRLIDHDRFDVGYWTTLRGLFEAGVSETTLDRLADNYFAGPMDKLYDQYRDGRISREDLLDVCSLITSVPKSRIAEPNILNDRINTYLEMSKETGYYRSGYFVLDSLATDDLIDIVRKAGNTPVGDIVYAYCSATSALDAADEAAAYERLIRDTAVKEKLTTAVKTATEYPLYGDAGVRRLFNRIASTQGRDNLWLLEKCIDKRMTLEDIEETIPGMELGAAGATRRSYLNFIEKTGMDIEGERYSTDALISLVKLENREQEKLGLSRHFDPDALLDKDIKDYVYSLAALETSANGKMDGVTSIAVSAAQDYHLSLEETKAMAELFKSYLNGDIRYEDFSDRFFDMTEKHRSQGPVRVQLGRNPFGNFILSDGTKVPKRRFDRDTRNAITEAIEFGLGSVVDKLLKKNNNPEVIRSILTAARDGIDVAPISRGMMSIDVVNAYIEGARAGIMDIAERIDEFEVTTNGSYAPTFARNDRYLTPEQIRTYASLINDGHDKSAITRLFEGNPVLIQERLEQLLSEDNVQGNTSQDIEKEEGFSLE